MNCNKSPTTAPVSDSNPTEDTPMTRRDIENAAAGFALPLSLIRHAQRHRRTNAGKR